MVAKKVAALNKSEEIRKALAQYSDKEPAEIARMLTERHGVPFQRKTVSKLKTKLEHKPAPVRKPAAPAGAAPASFEPLRADSAVPTAGGSVAAMATKLQAYIQRLGKQDLHRLIDTL
jgi:hypothetical protein